MYTDFQNYFTLIFLRGLYNHIIKICHITLIVFLPTLWNLKITIAADFNGLLHASCETSEFILQDIRPP